MKMHGPKTKKESFYFQLLHKVSFYAPAL